MYFNSNSMLVFFIACGCLTLMYLKQSFIKNVYGKSFDISEIILGVKSFLCSCVCFLSQAKNSAETTKTTTNNTLFTFPLQGLSNLLNNKKTPEGAYAGCVGLRKNYGYVGWKWKLSSVCNKCVQERRRCSVKN